MVDKGNLSYVRNYEVFFDAIYVVYLLGSSPRVKRLSKVRFISLGGRFGGAWFDFICAPFRLLKFVNRIQPTSFLTMDIMFSWWTACLIRLFGKGRIVLMPVCLPEQIYRNGFNTLSGLPKWIERIFTKFCFRSAESIITSSTLKGFIEWLAEIPIVKHKLVVVSVFAEEFPASIYFKESELVRRQSISNPPILLYVGRLHVEKRPYDLLELMAHLKTAGQPAKLKLVGDGPERKAMEMRAIKLGIRQDIEFMGYLPNDALPKIYFEADIFISTLTGTSLREAAMSGLPVVGLDTDWVKGFFIHEETALLVPLGDNKALAHEVIRIIKDTKLREKISKGIRHLMMGKFSPSLRIEGLIQIFGQDTKNSS